jgi:hypothetical protein
LRIEHRIFVFPEIEKPPLVARGGFVLIKTLSIASIACLRLMVNGKGSMTFSYFKDRQVALLLKYLICGIYLTNKGQPNGRYYLP